MFRVERKAPDRLDLHLSGSLDHVAMGSVLEQLCAEAEDMQHGRMLYRIEDFAWPTFEALLVELRFLPRMFRMLHAIDRVAVVADASWVRKVSELEGALFPGLEIEAFEPERLAEAEAWLEGRGP